MTPESALLLFQQLSVGLAFGYLVWVAFAMLLPGRGHRDRDQDD